ncbi:MAG: M14 family metallopeptidase [Amphiplicatus sp.]
MTGPGAFEIGVAPEDAPINPSAWYAFAVDADEAANVDVTLVYSNGKHRYAPKIKTNAAEWTELTDIKVAEDGAYARFPLRILKGRTLVAAQPLLGADDYGVWLQEVLQAAPHMAEVLVGHSEEGRAIEGLKSRKRAREAVVLIGRQHPPETTGAIAFFAFAERMLADDPLAKRFRKRFGLLIIPMLNPDGVAHGQWRHNSRGVDINRDWGPFTQAETRAARDAIVRFVGDKPGKLALFLDFHSTWRDVLYTQPNEARGARAWFAAAWRAQIEKNVGSAPDRSDSHNPALPTSKSWAHETYAVPAITFELGDTTPTETIRELAQAAAETAMTLLLDGQPQDPETQQEPT